MGRPRASQSVPEFLEPRLPRKRCYSAILLIKEGLGSSGLPPNLKILAKMDFREKPSQLLAGRSPATVMLALVLSLFVIFGSKFLHR